MSTSVRPEPTTSTPNEYDALLDSAHEEQHTALSGAAFVAAKRPGGQQWAEIDKLAQSAGLPRDVVARNLDAVRASVRPQQPDLAAVARETPALATALTDPDFHTIAKDEIPVLQRVERGVRSLLTSRQPTPGDLVSGAVSRVAGPGAEFAAPLYTGLHDLKAAGAQLAAAYGLMAPEHAAQIAADANRVARDARALAPSYVADYRGTTDAIRQQYREGKISSPAMALDLLGAAIANPRATLYGQMEAAPSFVPAIVGGMVGARGGPVGLGAGTFAGMAPVALGQELNAELQKQGVDIHDPAALAAAYRNPALMDAVRKKAERKGITMAGVASLVSMFGGAMSASAAESGAGALTQGAAKVGDVAVQAGGMAAADAASQKAGGEKVDLGQSMETAIAMLGQEAVTTAVGASARAQHHADPIEAAHEVYASAGDAMEAQRAAQALAEVGAAVKEAPATASVPDRVKQLVELAHGGEETPAHVYFQTGEWDHYWTEQGASPAKAAADIMGDGGRAYDEARTTGAPLAVPLGDYVSKVAPTEHFQGLLAAARTKPDGMSLGEAHDYLAKLPATLKAIADEATMPAAPDGATAIGQNVEAQLRAAGRTASESKAGGALYSSFFRTMADRAGLDPQALWDRYRLRIQRQSATERIARAKELPASETPITTTAADEIAAGELATDATLTPEFERARTATGRLKALGKVSDDALANEYRLMVDANATENTAPTSMEGDAGAYQWVGMKDGAAKAMGRIAARAKTIAKLEAELTKRGIDPVEAYQRGRQNALMQDDATAFPFGSNEFNQAPKPEALSAWAAGVQESLGLKRFDVHQDKDGTIRLAMLEVAKESRKQGIGSQAMEQLVRYADEHGQRIVLTPDVAGNDAGTTSRGRLVQFYKRFGFVENKGRSRDFRISDAMVREPATREFNQPAYHGSPHAFDEFSIHKIGSGEGAQAYGWGLYFAQRKEIAQWYREKLTAFQPRRIEGLSHEEMLKVPFGALSAIERFSGREHLIRAQIRTQIEHAKAHLNAWRSRDDATAEREVRRTREDIAMMQQVLDLPRIAFEPKASGRLFHVDVPEDDRLLHWEKPLSQQPPQVQQGLKALERFGIKLDPRMSGEDAYRRIQAVRENDGAYNGAQDASMLLSGHGIAGIKYLDGTSRHTGDGTPSHNFVIFDDKLVKVLQYEQRQPGGEARGRIQFKPDGTVAIDLFASADRSTFLHESGHFYLGVLHDLASEPTVPAALKADYATVREWLGAEGDAPITVEQHEQFARGFERYLMEGKAPSTALRDVFFRFKQWLVGLYTRTAALRVEISPEVRAVFDRLLASDREIAQAETATQARPLFDDPRALGLSEDEAARYSAAVHDAHQAAEEQLTTRLMREVERESSKEWKTLREPIEAEVRQQVADSPVYRALRALGDDLTIDRTAAKEVLGDAYPQLPKKVTASEGGLHPDMAAEALGFDSGRELLVALAHAPAEKALVQHLTDERMQLEHGERMTPAQIHETATSAVLSEKRQAVLRKELQLLASDHLAALKGMVKAVTRRVPPTETVKAEAARIIGQKPIRELQPRLFELAVARHGAEARDRLLRGDVEGAFQAKEKELLATAVHRAAVEAREAVDAAREEWKRIFRHDSTVAKGRDIDLVNAARAVLASFGFGRSEKPPASYLEQIRQYDPDAYEFLAPLVSAATDRAPADGSYKSLPYDDFVALRETVDGLWTLSRRTKQIEIDGQLLDRDEVHQALAERLDALTPEGAKAGVHEAVTPWQHTKLRLLGVKSALRRVEHWVTAMDGGPTGEFRRFLWNPIEAGVTAYRVAKHEAIERYRDVVQGMEGRPKLGAVEAPELGYTFKGRAELLGALLHAGNESNLSKLLRGRSWGEYTETGALDRSRWDAFVLRLQKDGTLTKADYDYLQGVWDLFEAYKPGAQRAHKAMYGHYFAEITATPVETPFGTYRGGYVPAKADPTIVPDAAIRSERQQLLENHNGSLFPTTGRGFTKSRVEAYAAPLIMDASRVPSFLDAVLRFTHIEPRVKDVARVVLNREVATGLDGIDPTARKDMLVPWLQRAASQSADLPSSGWFGKGVDDFARYLRSNAGLQVFAANTVVIAEQLTHFPSVLVKVPASGLARALWEYARAPHETAADIAERSPYMATRESAAMIEARKSIERIMLDRSLANDAADWIREHGFVLMRGIQTVVDHITWTASYDQAIGEGVPEAEAIRRADSTVREALGAFGPEDVSRLEAGSPMTRLLTMAYSFYNTKANMLGTEFGRTMRDAGLRKGAGRLLYVYTMGFMVPAVLGGAIKHALAGKQTDPEDDGSLDNLLALFLGSQAEMGARFVPIAGGLALGAAEQFGHGKRVSVLNSPAINTLESAASAPGEVYHAIVDGTHQHGAITDFLTLLGLLTRLPLKPLAKPLQYLDDVHTGRATPTGPFDYGRGLLTGQPGESR